MQYVTPEKAGISSESVQKFLAILEKNRLSTHNVIFARGNDIFFEHYWPPFHADFQHRMYSVSKSVVSIAAGFAVQEGLFSLDDKIADYFPEEAKAVTDENMRNQTIRHHLMMATSKPPKIWTKDSPSDLVEYYFQNDNPQSRPSGTMYFYDSTGSFLVGALIERLTGMPFMEYLRPRLFDKIGVSKGAHCLTCPGGHSWGDSGILCPPMDLLKIARFMLNGGSWNNEQLLDADYVAAAVSKQIDNDFWDQDVYNTQGYGYLFWRTHRNSFFFNGMGCQFAVCVPDLDLVFIYNGDNQGRDDAKKIIFDAFFDVICEGMQPSSICEDKAAQDNLKAYCDTLKLAVARGERHSAFEKEINGVWYKMNENPMGIRRFCLTFSGDDGVFAYENAQGAKKLPFRMCENAFAKFPQEGYSNLVGGEITKDFYYDCATSGAWVEEKKLYLKVQIIDKYLGRLNITIGYDDQNKAGVYMCKSAENFLNEYEGYGSGVPEA